MEIESKEGRKTVYSRHKTVSTNDGLAEISKMKDRNRERLFPVLQIVIFFFLMPIDPRFFLKRDCKHTLLFFWALH